MRPRALVLVALASCGGQVAPRPGDAVNPTGDASVTDGTFEDGTGGGVAARDGAVEEAGATDVSVLDSFVQVLDTSLPDTGLPAVGTPACQDVPCVLCADGYYHCHSEVYTPCAPGIDTSMSCLADGIPGTGCFACDANGSGNLWQCETDGGWSLSPYGCTP